MMNNYKKQFILLLLVALAIFGFAALWPTKNKNFKAFEFFKESNYKMASNYAAQSPLLESYILRESKSLEASNSKLKKVLKEANGKELFEIRLNLALNAYLAGNVSSFHTEMANLRKLENTHGQFTQKLPYFSLFKGLDAFLDADYECAISYFEKHQDLPSFSPWMEHVFKKEFDEAFIAEKTAFSFAETQRLQLAFEKVDAIKKKDENRFHFLKAFYAARAGSESFKLHLDLIEVQKINLKEYSLYFDHAHKYFLESLRHQSWQEFSCWQDFFNRFSLLVDITPIVASLKQEVKASVLLERLTKELRVKLLYIVSAEIEQAFYVKDFKVLENNIGVSEEKSLIQKAEKLSFSLVSCKNESIETCVRSIEFWSKIEKNRQNRLEFAKKLVELAKNEWLFSNRPEKSKELFKIAFLIPEEEDKPLILEILTQALLKVHHKALNQSEVSHYFYVVEVAKSLNLNVIKLYNDQEKNDLLEAAKTFLLRGHYSQAHERAAFLLLLDERNEEANSLMNLIKKVYD